jgi:beta-lactamase class D
LHDLYHTNWEINDTEGECLGLCKLHDTPLINFKSSYIITNFNSEVNAAGRYMSNDRQEKGVEMKAIFILAIAMITAAANLAYGQTFPIPENTVSSAFHGCDGAFIIIDCVSGIASDFRPDASAESLPPCSTFKIWSTLIGHETGIIDSAKEDFYKWDGVNRAYAGWNRDLTLKEAFQVSCVPAFQSVARLIGHERMQLWIDKIEYGDRDISAGIDMFWLPAKGRKTILISPKEQAQLLCKLVSGTLPFSVKSLTVFKEIMKVNTTDHGILYGKTGSGADDRGIYILGWFVGYVESNGTTYAFACTAKGDNIMGKDARAIVENILIRQGIL